MPNINDEVVKFGTELGEVINNSPVPNVMKIGILMETICQLSRGLSELQKAETQEETRNDTSLKIRPEVQAE